MALKLVIFSCVVAMARGSVSPVALSAAPLAYAAQAVPVAARLQEYDPLPQYRFGYDVADSLTGDYKSQQEQRNGDIVQGSYSLVDPDGTRRIVDYAADPINGFNAVVRKEPLVAAAPAVFAQPAVVAARFAAAPVATRYAVAPPVYQQAAPARYEAAPVVARYAPVPAAAPVFARYAAAPFAAPIAARYAAAPVVAARYAAPVAAAYSAPVAAAYTAGYAAPVAAAYASAPVAAAYSTYAAPLAAEYASPARYALAPPAFRAAPAKLVEPVAAAGYRYP